MLRSAEVMSECPKILMGSGEPIDHQRLSMLYFWQSWHPAVVNASQFVRPSKLFVFHGQDKQMSTKMEYRLKSQHMSFVSNTNSLPCKICIAFRRIQTQLILNGLIIPLLVTTCLDLCLVSDILMVYRILPAAGYEARSFSLYSTFFAPTGVLPSSNRGCKLYP